MLPARCQMMRLSRRRLASRRRILDLPPSGQRAGRRAFPSPLCQSVDFRRSPDASPIQAGSPRSVTIRRICSVRKRSRQVTPSTRAMFAPALGVREDRVTGAAAAAFAGVLAAWAGLADGEHAITIEQGYEMGRPSLIRLAATLAGGKLVSASIGGDAVIVTEGSIEA